MEIKKVINFISPFVLGFTVYYAVSVYNGSRKMIDYDVAISENKKELQNLDSLEIVLAKTPYDANVKEMFAKQKLSAQRDREKIRMNKEIGTGVYCRRLIKFYCGLCVLILSSIVWFFLRRKKDGEA